MTTRPALGKGMLMVLPYLLLQHWTRKQIMLGLRLIAAYVLSAPVQTAQRSTYRFGKIGNTSRAKR
jgi:hypothetical protein